MKKYFKKLNNQNFINKIFNISFILVTVLILIQTFLEIYYGRIPFWYDPARDMLLGLQNLDNPTLIGQPTGIPGVFYGPYWIWLISFLQIFNKDPRFLSVFLLLIPYFTLFLFVLLKFSKIISRESVFIFWLLFILSFSNYFSFLWNPHLMPLFLLIFIYLVVILDFQKKGIKNLLTALFAGISMGISANFSMSIGIGLILGICLFMLVNFFYIKYYSKEINILDYLIICIFIFMGIFLTFAPFILFEVRHGFNQINSYLNASMNKITGLTGLSDIQIIINFLNIPSKIFLIQSIVIYLIIFVSVIILKIKNFELSKISDKEFRLLILIFCISFSVIGLYIFSKNPVWDYHFIGFEILFLIFLGILINRNLILKYLALVSVLILFLVQLISFNYKDNIIYDDSLRSKEAVIKDIITDADGNHFTYYAYSPSIYTYEYDYLFKNKKLINLYSNDVLNPKVVYIIFDKKHLFDMKGFIDSKTSNDIYKTTKTLRTSNGGLIIKRELINN